jgi:hypothetical protein
MKDIKHKLFLYYVQETKRGLTFPKKVSNDHEAWEAEQMDLLAKKAVNIYKWQDQQVNGVGTVLVGDKIVADTKADQPTDTTLDFVDPIITPKYLKERNLTCPLSQMFFDRHGKWVGNCPTCKVTRRMDSKQCRLSRCKSKLPTAQFVYARGDKTKPYAKLQRFNPAFISIVFGTKDGDIYPEPRLPRNKICEHENAQATQYLSQNCYWDPDMRGGHTQMMGGILNKHVVGDTKPFEKFHSLWKGLIDTIRYMKGDRIEYHLGFKPKEEFFDWVVSKVIVSKEINRFHPYESKEQFIAVNGNTMYTGVKRPRNH